MIFDDLTEKFYWLSADGTLIESRSTTNKENGARMYVTACESVLTYHTLGLAMELKQEYQS